MTSIRQILPSCAAFLAIAALLCAFVGCSNDGKTQLQGEVTYGGEPLALGTITFTPVNDGFRTLQTIKDGKFDIAAKNGVVPGQYNVAIEGYEEMPEDNPDQVAKKLFPDYATTYTVVEGQAIVIDVPKKD